MKKITLLATLGIAFGLTFALSSCGNKKSEEDIDFRSYSNEVTEAEFTEKYNALTTKTFDVYTLNSYSYKKSEYQKGDVSTYRLEEEKEVTKYNKQENKYAYVSDEYHYIENPNETYKISRKKDLYKVITEDDSSSYYSKEETVYDNIDLTYYTSYSYKSYSGSINPVYNAPQKSTSESNTIKYFVDDDLFTVVIKSKEEKKKDYNDLTQSDGYNYEYKFQLKLGEKEAFIKYKLVNEYSYSYTEDNVKTKYKNSSVTVYSKEYILEAPTFDVIDTSKYTLEN